MIVAYADKIAAGTLTDIGSIGAFEPTAPLTNAQDRRLAVKAIYSGYDVLQVRAAFSSTTVGIVGILGHTFVRGGFAFNAKFYNGSNVLLLDMDLEQDHMSWSEFGGRNFPQHAFFILPTDLAAVARIDLTMYANTPTSSFGRLWASSTWRPSFKTGFQDFEVATRDDSIVTRSVGQQIYVDYRGRYRQLRCNLSALTEVEAIGEQITGSGVTPNLQDIAFEVGRGGEVIVIPSEDSVQVVNRLGVYGVFADPPAVRLRDRNTDLGRIYSSNFDVIETL